MNTTKTILVTLMLALFGMSSTYAQVGIGTTTPATDAVLDLTATNKALLLTRVAFVGLIATPVNGMIVYDELYKCVRPYENNAWGDCLNGTAAATLTGAELTNHYNGIVGGVHDTTSPNDPTYYTLSTYTTGEKFSDNTVASTKTISTTPCSPGETVTGASGTVYNTVDINGQCWMKENLKELPNGVAVTATANEWLNTTQTDNGYYGYYNTTTVDGSAGWGTIEPVAGEGLLYQWSAAMLGSTAERAQGVCPTGWHIPSDAEWMYLEHGQGMSLSEQIKSGYRADGADNQGTPGYKLRSAGTGQTNNSGFSGLLAGSRRTEGTFVARSSATSWWSSSATDNTNSFSRHVYTVRRGVLRRSLRKAYGFSVRCLKD